MGLEAQEQRLAMTLAMEWITQYCRARCQMTS
jgi:hypothetical protein